MGQFSDTINTPINISPILFFLKTFIIEIDGISYERHLKSNTANANVTWYFLPKFSKNCPYLPLILIE